MPSCSPGPRSTPPLSPQAGGRPRADMDEQFQPVSAARIGSERPGAVSCLVPAPELGMGHCPTPWVGWEVGVRACFRGGRREGVCQPPGVGTEGSAPALLSSRGGTGICACPNGVLCQTAVTRPGWLGDSRPTHSSHSPSLPSPSAWMGLTMMTSVLAPT